MSAAISQFRHTTFNASRLACSLNSQFTDSHSIVTPAHQPRPSWRCRPISQDIPLLRTVATICCPMFVPVLSRARDRRPDVQKRSAWCMIRARCKRSKVGGPLVLRSSLPMSLLPTIEFPKSRLARNSAQPHQFLGVAGLETGLGG
jgi:hypothetical protein